MSFFGFDTALPGRPQQGQGQGQGQQPQGQARGQQGQSGTGGFQGFANTSNTAFGTLGDIGAEEDIAVYNWGESMGGLEDGDDVNDETFGGGGDVGEFCVLTWSVRLPRRLYVRLSILLILIGNDFNFGSFAPSQPAAAPKAKPTGRGPIASTQSRYKPKAVIDPFAFSEDDFYSSRRPATSALRRIAVSQLYTANKQNPPNPCPSKLPHRQPLLPSALPFPLQHQLPPRQPILAVSSRYGANLKLRPPCGVRRPPRLSARPVPLPLQPLRADLPRLARSRRSKRSKPKCRDWPRPMHLSSLSRPLVPLQGCKR